MVWSIYSSFLRTPRSVVDSSQRHQDLLGKILENAENRTQGFWVRSANAPSVLCPPDPPPPPPSCQFFDFQFWSIWCFDFFWREKKFSKQQKKFVSIFCSNFFSATYFFSRCKKKIRKKSASFEKTRWWEEKKILWRAFSDRLSRAFGPKSFSWLIKRATRGLALKARGRAWATLI